MSKTDCYTIPMALGMAFPVAAAGFALGLEAYPTASLWLLSGALIVYYREVVQQQAKRHGFAFEYGWLPWKWSANKNIETWIAVIPLTVAGIVIGAAS